LVVINMQLLDAKTAKVLWAERASRPLSNIIELEEELAVTIAQKLAVQLQPGERARLSQYHSVSSAAWLFYRQGLVTIMPPSDLVRVQAARQLFDRASQVDPSFSGGHAGHSFAHSARVLFMTTTDPAWELANAKAMAQKAIDLDPEFGAGYAMLAFANILAGEHEQALTNAQKSVSIQPGDAFARFIIGMSLMISEQPRESIPHLKEALRLDPLESRMPYLNVLGIGYFVTQDFSNALKTVQQNYERGGPRGPHMELFLAASHAELGDLEKAQAIVTSMQKNHPEFPAKRWMARWILDKDRLEETLEKLGLDG
jgi:adenylate cyclase